MFRRSFETLTSSFRATISGNVRFHRRCFFRPYECIEALVVSIRRVLFPARRVARLKKYFFFFYPGPEAVRQALDEARGATRGEKFDHLLRRGLHQHQLPTRRLSRSSDSQGNLDRWNRRENATRASCFQISAEIDHAGTRLYENVFFDTHFAIETHQDQNTRDDSRTV